MECTGGFRALRSHVQAAKASSSRPGSGASYRRERRDERRDGEDEDGGDSDQVSAHLLYEGWQIRCNQERLWEDERHLNALRAAFLKDQKELKERERGVRMMETSLQESGERVAEKEKGLDTRIQEIMRLESRLHEALEEKQHRAASTEPEQSDNNNSKSTGKEQEEREAALVVQEDELKLTRERAAEREKHLILKERVLSEKAVELSALSTELERKDALREREAAAQRSKWELERESQYENLERQLREQYERKTTQVATAQQEVRSSNNKSVGFKTRC
ncbi:hypothetical protein Gpo141_00012317 [Globisporangium polare]